MPGCEGRREFQISRKAREQFRFDDTFFSITGDILLVNPQAAQLFATELNDKRKKEIGRGRKRHLASSSPVTASEINAMGLFHEVLHFIIASYEKNVNRQVFDKLDNWLSGQIGKKDLSGLQHTFLDLFPPTPVFRNEVNAETFLSGNDFGLNGRRVVFEELILLWLQNRNPAFDAIADLIDDSALDERSAYEKALAATNVFFDTQPGYGPADSPLLKMLLAPIQASPESISGQLQFIVENWGDILKDSPFLTRILRAIDFVKEEGKYFMMLAQAQADKAKIPNVRRPGFEGFGERASEPVLKFRGTGAEYEPENFSADLGWMPRLVLIAKNVFVWLDQLSKKYRRQIDRLDLIPDEELETLAHRGFTGLWLIGIWKRSEASRKIKHLNGNPDAIASAYSLDAYEIASELGGDQSYRNLKDRAWRHGVRLASDMVPNHMGIDSTWLINHPDWFLSSEYPPYPNYSFNGPDLSGDERVGIFIEDGYWSKRDASVVFKRLDRWTGEVRHVYHGNDGTHMPWNDTAQLDFTKPEVREAVIQRILHVAKMFPIIRFDAAMVLSKKHYQRLWFPEPGTGGAIPSRSNFSMTKEEFDTVMPVEFWREVVDRIQHEAPDTLLLAEAFWLMEGYFVRTLGMHRVYNSAFMNMLKREENGNYRQVIKNVLEYNPQILKRFVNFLNNPDEETAIAQFGKDDKYFGVCVLMATMPGLPMFGHGQVEGLTEKYGMEFKRAYRDEREDESLVARHDREIFPLLRMRQYFSEVDNFFLYDFFVGNGQVNEDVFAYSNRSGIESNLVVYNNRYTHTAGWVKTSVAFRDPSGKLIQKNLAEGLSLTGGQSSFVIFRDVISGVEYIRSTKSVKRDGLFIELGAYKYSVFEGFNEVRATRDKPYDELCRSLNGRGVGSVAEELWLMKLSEIHAAYCEALNGGSLRYLVEGMNDGKLRRERVKILGENVSRLDSAVKKYHRSNDPSTVESELDFYKAVPVAVNFFAAAKAAVYIKRMVETDYRSSLKGLRLEFLYFFLKVLAKSAGKLDGGTSELVSEFRLTGKTMECFSVLGVEGGTAEYELNLACVLVDVFENVTIAGEEVIRRLFLTALGKASVQSFLALHEYDGVRWFNKERFDDFIAYYVITAGVEFFSAQPGARDEDVSRCLEEFVEWGAVAKRIASKAGYRFDRFVNELSAPN